MVCIVALSRCMTLLSRLSRGHLTESWDFPCQLSRTHDAVSVLVSPGRAMAVVKNLLAARKNKMRRQRDLDTAKVLILGRASFLPIHV